jgi:hypothetical protein
VNPAFKWAMRLFFAKGWDTGSHDSYGTVLYRERRIWQLTGSDLYEPSLIGLAGVNVGDVQWVVDRTREEPVT